MSGRKQLWLLAAALLVSAAAGLGQEPSNARRASSNQELRAWLVNMVWYHRFSHLEISEATGIRADEVPAVLAKFGIEPSGRPERRPGDPLVVLPYPGGRHPRRGFLEGAIRPQRETKVSVFTAWDPSSYVVVDVPEAIWSNLGLTYLAHTHVPTVWTRQGIELAPLEWKAGQDGSLESERVLPNGIKFGARVMASAAAVRMELWLTNGTEQRLTDLRVQNCVMLKQAAGFDKQDNENKLFSPPYAACRNEDGSRWIITGWEPHQRVWANEKCPCLHSDPQFADCEAGETRRLSGWLSFYEGKDIQGELERIEQTGWRGEPAGR
ncbi:MAG: hypothetical protein WD278_19080 [Pirellulales bacterium]